MTIVIDTTAIIAVTTNEPHKAMLIDQTRGAVLIAPASLHWEIGNAFSAMFKQKRITLADARKALDSYRQIPLQLIDVPLQDALQFSANLKIYAYDAYMIACAISTNSPLLSLDSRLNESARQAGAMLIEVPS
jgi:predicted nucleic acid-binding protein